jgi:hypothetical protein
MRKIIVSSILLLNACSLSNNNVITTTYASIKPTSTPIIKRQTTKNNASKSNQEKEPIEVIYLKDLEAKKQEKPKISLRQEINIVNTSQDNIIDIVFDRKAKIRIENGTKNLSSEITDISELIKILEENNFISGVSLKHSWITDEEVERDAEDLAKIVEGPSTDRYSTQMYTFAKGTDILKVCNQLRKLSYVINANPPLSPTDT